MDEFIIEEMEEQIFKLKIDNKYLEECIANLERQVSNLIDEKEELEKRLEELEDIIRY